MTTDLPSDDPEDPNLAALRRIRPRYPRWQWLFLPALMLAILGGALAFLILAALGVGHLYGT